MVANKKKKVKPAPGQDLKPEDPLRRNCIYPLTAPFYRRNREALSLKCGKETMQTMTSAISRKTKTTKGTTTTIDDCLASCFPPAVSKKTHKTVKLHPFLTNQT